MEDNSEGAVADDLALCVGQISRLPSEAVLDPFADDFCKARWSVSAELNERERKGKIEDDCSEEIGEHIPPILRLLKAVGRFCDITRRRRRRGGGRQNRTLLSRVWRALVEHLMSGAWLECKGERRQRQVVQVRRRCGGVCGMVVSAQKADGGG